VGQLQLLQDSLFIPLHSRWSLGRPHRCRRRR
jgi:hypothetical protein